MKPNNVMKQTSSKTTWAKASDNTRDVINEVDEGGVRAGLLQG